MSYCKCEGKGCSTLKNQCYRFRKLDSSWQPYALLHEQHPTDPSIKCINFIALEGRKDLLPLELYVT